MTINYIFPRSAFFNLSFVWKEGLHDQVPVIATVQLQTPLCYLLSCGRAFGSVAKRYNLSLSKQSKLTKYPAGKQTRVLPNANRKMRTTFQFSHSKIEIHSYHPC